MRFRSTAPAWRFLIVALAFMLLAGSPLTVFAQSDGPPPPAHQTSSRSDEDDPDPTPDTSDLDPDLVDAGLTGPTSYESPQFGYEVVWTEDWEIGSGPDDPSSGAESSPDAAEPIDSLKIWSLNYEERFYVDGILAKGSYLDTGDPLAQTHVEQMIASQTDGTFDDAPFESMTVLLSDYDDEYGVVLYRLIFDNGTEWVSYSLVRDMGDYFIATYFSTDATEFMELYDQVEQTIEIEGDAPIALLDVDDIQEQIDAVIEDIASGGGGTTDPTPTPDTDDPDPTPTKEADDDADTAGYLSAVRNHADSLRTSIDRFFEIINAGEIDEAEADEVNAILADWNEALRTAERTVVPSGLENVQGAYISFVSAVDEMNTAFRAFLQAEDGSPERDAAITDFQNATDAAETAYDTLDELLQAQGS
jgi:hypothetical protein